MRMKTLCTLAALRRTFSHLIRSAACPKPQRDAEWKPGYSSTTLWLAKRCELRQLAVRSAPSWQ